MKLNFVGCVSLFTAAHARTMEDSPLHASISRSKAMVTKELERCRGMLRKAKEAELPARLLRSFAASRRRAESARKSRGDEGDNRRRTNRTMATAAAAAAGGSGGNSVFGASTQASADGVDVDSNSSSSTTSDGAGSGGGDEGGLDDFDIICKPCALSGHEAAARAFFSSPPSRITLCSNRLGTLGEVSEALTHELVHAVDYCQRGMDLGRCEPLACSEVRAAREAECRGVIDFGPFWSRKKCSRSKAMDAVGQIFPMEGEGCVERVFERCYADEGLGRERGGEGARGGAGAAEEKPG